MLFAFDDLQKLSFWMKDTRIVLSIAYIDVEGRIVDLQDMKPSYDEPPHYVSAVAAPVRRLGLPNVVVDPVIVAENGAMLLKPDASTPSPPSCSRSRTS